MSFDVLVIPTLFEKIPLELKGNIKSAIKVLNNPFPGEGEQERNPWSRRFSIPFKSGWLLLKK